MLIRTCTLITHDTHYIISLGLRVRHTTGEGTTGTHDTLLLVHPCLISRPGSLSRCLYDTPLAASIAVANSSHRGSLLQLESSSPHQMQRCNIVLGYHHYFQIAPTYKILTQSVGYHPLFHYGLSTVHSNKQTCTVSDFATFCAGYLQMLNTSLAGHPLATPTSGRGESGQIPTIVSCLALLAVLSGFNGCDIGVWGCLSVH